MRSSQLKAKIHTWVAPTQGQTTGARKPTLIEETIFGCTIGESPKFIPGILLTVGIVAAAILLTNWINEVWSFKGVVSYVLAAVILGMLIRNTLGLPAILRPGISISQGTVLKAGIILMGIRLSLSDVVTIGVWGLPIVVVCVITGLVVTTYITRLLNLPERLGTLIAVGSSICGATAILATAPAIEAKEDEVAYAVANITIFGIIVMFTYPYLADFLFAGDLVNVGLFLGTSIHNTAQVAGAGLIYDQTYPVIADTTTTDIAVIVKLVRNTMMVAVIPVMAFVYIRRMAVPGVAREQKNLGLKRFIPLFVVGFVIMAAVRSIGDASVGGSGLAWGVWDAGAWTGLIENVKIWAGYILAAAMAGVGLGTSFKAMKGLGFKPFLVGLVSATVVGFTAILLVILVGPLVSIL